MTLPITEDVAIEKEGVSKEFHNLDSKDSIMYERKTGFLLLAVSGLIASLLGQVGLIERLHAAPPNPFAQRAQKLDGFSTPARQYFGNRLPGTSSQQGVRRRLPAPRPLQLRGSKPFESLQRPPTFSPYLNLNIRESELGLPNYYAFVRPLQQQQNANRKQAANLRKLQQQVRTATATGIVSNNPNGGVPTTGHSSQFLNLGGYFTGSP